MARWRSFRERWLPVFVAFVIGGAFTGVAGAHSGFPDFLHANHSDTMNGTLTAKNFRYSSPKTNRLVVPGAAFVPDNQDTVFSHDNYSGAIRLGTQEAAEAPIFLPHGATVTKVTMFWDSGPADGDIALHLEANDTFGNHDDMALFSNTACAANPCSAFDDTIDPNVVNNNAAHYGLWLFNNSSGDIYVFKVIVTYTTTSVGPATGALPGTWRVSGSASH